MARRRCARRPRIFSTSPVRGAACPTSLAYLAIDERVAILDVLHTSKYASVLRESGMSKVERTRPYFLFFLPARVVSARKPPRKRF